MTETKHQYEHRTGAMVTDQQWHAWQNDLAGAASGNPYATMCMRCSGRHGPPRDRDCPGLSTRPATGTQEGGE